MSRIFCVISLIMAFIFFLMGSLHNMSLAIILASFYICVNEIKKELKK